MNLRDQSIITFQKTIKTFSLLAIAAFFILAASSLAWGQTTIAMQDFETTPASPVWNFTNTGTGQSVSAATGSGDTPANQRNRTGLQHWQVSSGTGTLDFAAVSVSGYNSVRIVVHLSSTSGTTGNGADAADYVRLFATLNGAALPANSQANADIAVNGNNNSRWSYNNAENAVTNAGTNLVVAGTAGTNAGTIYSTLVINIPNGTNTVALRAIALNNDTAEFWNIDDVTLTGTLATTNSTASTITATGGETANIPYAGFQDTTINAAHSNAVSVFSFNINDGGGTPDSDVLGTTLTAVTFNKGSNNSVTSWSNTIRQAALFDGTTKIAEVPVTGESIAFSGLSGTNVTAPDGGTKTLTLYLTFETTVIDNEQFQFTVTNTSVSADSAGSGFTTFTASTSVTGDNNRIEVTADRLRFVQQPAANANVSVNQAITPAVTVEAADVNNNRDLDYLTNVTISATGATLDPSSTLTATPTAGLATFGNIVFSNTATGVTFNAASGALAGATSNTFNVTTAPVVPAAGEIVINQFSGQYGGSSDEYIELLNKTNKTFDLSNLKINYLSTSGGGSYSATLSGTLQPYSFFLLSPNVTVTVNGQTISRDASFTAGFAQGGGQIALRLLDNTQIDGLAYGGVTTNTFGEGTAAASPPTNGGLKRNPDGTDTNVNSADFVTVAANAIRLRNSGSRFTPANGTLASGTYTDVSVSGNSTLSGNVTVTGTLTLADGVLVTGANTLTLDTTATVSRTSGFVEGNVSKLFAVGNGQSFEFPVGTVSGNDDGYTPVSLTNLNVTTAGDGLTVAAFDAPAPSNPGVQRISRYWLLTQVGGAINTTLTFNYLAGEDSTLAVETTDRRIFRNNASACSASSVCSYGANSATITNVSSFSPWTIAQLAPTAASVDVGGRIVENNGRGIFRARVTMTDSQGNMRTTYTNQFGLYQFKDVPAGQNYIFSATHLRFNFNQPTQVRFISGDEEQINFTAADAERLLKPGDKR